MKLPACKTKIVATIGPASESLEVMERMIRAGMNVARLNFSHGAFEGHRRAIENLRAASRRAGQRVTIMGDLSGPKMRIGRIAGGPVMLEAGAPFTLTTEEVPGDACRVSVSFSRLPRAVKPGDTLYLNDGYIELEVRNVRDTEVDCRVLVGGELTSRKGLNLPGIDLGISAFTDYDRECLTFAMEAGVDAVSQSFVENASDVEAVRQAAEAIGYRPFLLAKIERAGALDHLDGILAAADGIMIARGDLGVEIPIEGIAVVQKELTHRANRLGKPVITATQMLESMTGNRRPTRAEATDVANAILDGTDCVMLSGESAVGRYPVAAVAMLAAIASATEPHRRSGPDRAVLREVDREGGIGLRDLTAISVEAALEHTSAAAVFVPTLSGASARSVARFRLPVWIVGVSPRESTCVGLQFSCGVYPVLETEHPGEWKPYVAARLREFGVDGDLVILTEGPSSKNPEANHRMEILDLRMTPPVPDPEAA